MVMLPGSTGHLGAPRTGAALVAVAGLPVVAGTPPVCQGRGGESKAALTVRGPRRARRCPFFLQRYGPGASKRNARIG